MPAYLEPIDTLDPRHWQGRWTLHLDMLLTRRKIFHLVTDPSGETVFRSRHVSECIAYLLDMEVSEYSLQLAPDRSGIGPRLTIRTEE